MMPSTSLRQLINACHFYFSNEFPKHDNSTTLNDGSKIEINSQIVRVERDNDSPESEKNILVAFDFINPKLDVQEPLKKYLEQCELTASHVVGTS